MNFPNRLTKRALYKELRSVNRLLKLGEERKMCETFEMLRAEGRKEEREKLQNEYLKALIKSKRFTLSEISTNFNIPMDVISERAKQLSLS